ncbi:MAG TPA: hypothetical protein VIH42_13560 [Thermoguttaceae bacterium]
MLNEHLIDQIREIRHRISEECGHDPQKLVEYYMRLESEEYADRIMKSKQSKIISETQH